MSAAPDTFVCIASGPSLTQADVDHVRGRARVLVVNDNWRKAPWADVHYGADGAWWELYWPEIRAHTRCERWTMGAKTAEELGLNLAHRLDGCGLSDVRGRIYLGQVPGNPQANSDSGFHAIQLAYQYGAQRIVLLGYDLQHTAGKAHWFGDHPDGFNNAPNIQGWRPKYDYLARLLADAGVELINCTRQTALTAVPRRDLRAVL